MNLFLRTLSDAIALNADADTLMSTHLGLEKVGGHIYFFQFLKYLNSKSAYFMFVYFAGGQIFVRFFSI